MSSHSGFIKMVEAIFEKDYSPEGLRVLERNLQKYPNDVYTQVTKELESGDLKWRPKPKDLVDHCQVVNRRMHPVAEKKAEKPKSTDDIQRKIHSKLTALIMSGKASWQEILDKIREADKFRPNSGWDKVGIELERHHAVHKTDLSKPPDNVSNLEL